MAMEGRGGGGGGRAWVHLLPASSQVEMRRGDDNKGILGRGRAGSRDQGHSLTLFGPTRLILVAQDRRLPARLAARVEGGIFLISYRAASQPL